MLILGGSVSYCLSASEIYSNKVNHFEITPKVCIVSQSGEVCFLKSKVKLQLRDNTPVCLNLENESIFCWQNAQLVDEELQFSLQRTSEIFVVDQKNTKLASAILSVNSHNPNKKRRRLRSAWSLF